MRNSWLAAPGLAAAVLVMAACGSSGSGNSGSGSGGSSSPASPSPMASHSTSAAGALKTMKIGGATVLTNAKGFTIYWFAADTKGKSNCNGSCTQFWPPVPGPATAGHGVKGTLGTITRSDGKMQATWNGHPLYTYINDKAPGQAKGNGLNISGGVWHEVKLAGKSSSGGGGGGGGYGY